MADERLRRLEREARAEPEDPAREGRLLRERLRAGEVSGAGLELLARLGHAPARAALELPPDPVEPGAFLDALAAAPPEVRGRALAALARAVPLMDRDRFDGPSDGVLAAQDALDACLLEPGPERLEALAAAVAAAAGGAWGGGDMAALAVVDAGRLVLAEPWSARQHLGLAQEAVDRLLEPGRYSPFRSTPEDLREEVRRQLAELLLGGRDPVLARRERLGARLGAVPNLVRALAASRDGTRLLVTYRGRGARLLELPSGRELAALPHEAVEVWAALALEVGGWATGDGDGALRVWEREGALARTIAAHPEDLRALALLPGGVAVSGGGEGALAAWDLATGRELWRRAAHPRPVAALAASSAGALASGDADGTLLLFPPGRAEPARRATARAGVSGLGFLDEERLLVGGDRLLEVWDARELSPLRRLEPAPGSVHDLAVAPPGALAMTVGGHQHEVLVWDLAAGAIRRQGFTHAVPLACAWLPGAAGGLPAGAFLTGSRTGALRVWSPG